MANKKYFDEIQSQYQQQNQQAQPAAGSGQDWSSQVADLYDQITNRPGFSYDPGSDPLYQNYKNQYVQNGRRAMEDTMGQATSLTGGYNSSYAQAVGQQQYGDYMTKLSAEVPNLYAQARSAYDKEGDDLYNRYNMAMAMEQQQYARDRDAIADQRYQDELDYGRQQDAQNRAYNMVMQMLQTGQTPSAEMLSAAGVDASWAGQMARYYAGQLAGYGGGSSGSGGRSSSGGRGSGGGSGNGTGTDNADKDLPTLDIKKGTITNDQMTDLWNRAKQYGIEAAARYAKTYYSKTANYDKVVQWLVDRYKNYNGQRMNYGNKLVSASGMYR